MEMRVELEGTECILLPEKALFWQPEKILMIADLHLGKINHFRRSGVALPDQPNEENLNRMISLIRSCEPDRVLFLGDLFHSHYNDEWEAFGQVLSHYPGISFELVMGNHDIMSRHQYEKHRLKLHDPTLEIGPFLLSHEPLEDFEGYNIAGHIHPGVRMFGKGRQRLRFPCFFFGSRQGILPAFGAFTGTHPMKPKEEDQIFIIAENRVIRVK
ncbi:ligase-associated DNA damage response endonuclease PdeM [Fulvivirga sedimenti]|uniref:Ligase-associated DNA damage response endonuclease PdeM n=1 Tax=Fulvivirga sedimenti TaxID=2879465 RepID=A0A9X1KWX8_9BACT|nr:ligase-associated DNA damage response endonuclease PdeM [Fulvivirga sedimenti]MCA6073697.1 ligase-associated DNA damage response endonuclease PdeM [Fulvivirga sedimenti]